MRKFLDASSDLTVEAEPNWWDNLIPTVINWLTTTGLKIVIALIILFVSFKVINYVGRKIEKSAENKDADKTLVKTLAYFVKLALKIVVVICLIGYLGIDTSGFTALVAALGVCAGLAVNGALSNVAGGVLIILTRPFKLDDYIDAQGYSGTVEAIHLTYTKLKTTDNKVVFIPNGPLSGGTVVNYSLNNVRRVDFEFSIAYSSDFEKAKSIIYDILVSHKLALKEPEAFVRVSEHGASSIKITARVWTKAENYWTVNYDVLEAVKKAFDENGIEIPFEQLDVHVKNK